MLAADRDGLHVHQAASGEDCGGRGSAPHVDADRPEVHFILLEGGQGGDKGRGGDALEGQVGALDAGGQHPVGGLGDGHHQELYAEDAAEHLPGIADPGLGVHGPGDRQDVDGLAVLQLQLGHGRPDGPGEVLVGDGTGAEGDAARNPASGQLAAGRGDGDALDPDLGHSLGPLDRLGDGLGGLVDVDDGPVSHAPRLHVGDARGGECTVDPPDPFGLHDEAGHLAGAQVHGRCHVWPAEGRLQALPGFPTRFKHGHQTPPVIPLRPPPRLFPSGRRPPHAAEPPRPRGRAGQAGQNRYASCPRPGPGHQGAAGRPPRPPRAAG